MWLFPNGSCCGSYTLTAAPPSGSPFATFNVQNVNVTSDKSVFIALQFVHNPPAPSINNVSVNPSSMWPPDHKMVDVTVGYTTTGSCGAVTTSLSVTSNEPADGTGDGDMAPDWEIVDSHHVRLRAERAGTGTGRIYTIAITCTDSIGNSAVATATVTVAQSQR
jgi:hypothetical protein